MTSVRACCAASMRGLLVPEGQQQCDGSHHDKADGPDRIQIEPAARYEFETKIAVNKPCQVAARSDHRGCVDDGDQHSHSETCADKRPGCLVRPVEAGLPADSKIDRH